MSMIQQLFGGKQKNNEEKAQNSVPSKDDAPTHDEGATTSESSSENDQFRPKRSRVHQDKLTEDEYVMVAKDIMGKPPFSGYLKYHLPLKYAARCEEVRWTWQDEVTGKTVYKELIGGGRNSDLEYN